MTSATAPPQPADACRSRELDLTPQTRHDSGTQLSAATGGPLTERSEGILQRNGHRRDRASAAIATLAARLARRDELAHELSRFVQDAAPSPPTAIDPIYQAGLRATVAALLSHVLAAIEAGPAFAAPMPAEVGEQARRAARAGVGSQILVSRYVAGHRRLGELFEQEARSARLELHALTVTRLHVERERLLDDVLALVLREYEAERERIAAEHRLPFAEEGRSEIVTRLLLGVEPSVEQRVALRYQLDAWHLGLVATGPGGRTALQRVARSFSGELLLIPRSDTLAWGWLGARGQARLSGVAVTLGELLAGEDALLAIGEPGWGAHGFARTHRQAQAAIAVTLHRGDRLTAFRDVALEASALQDAALGDALLARWLAPLDGPRDGGQQRRSVIRAVLAAEGNRSSAAQALKLDRETVRRRLSEVEDRLGCQLAECHAEIEIALRVEELRLRERAGTAGSS